MISQPQFRLSANAFDRPDFETTDAKAVIFISSEGTETEPDYFEQLNSHLDRKSPYIIHVLKHDRDTMSDPRHVLDLLEECRNIRSGRSFFGMKSKNKELRLTEKLILKFFNTPDTFSKKKQEEFKIAVTKLGIDVDYYRYLREIGTRKNGYNDRFALVIDRDGKCHNLKTLEEIRDICRERNFDFCLSNPCFDLWLILHLEFQLKPSIKRKLLCNSKVSNNNTESSIILSQHAHHAKHISKTTFEKIYLPKIRHASKRATRLASSDTDILSNIGTRVPLIIDKVLPYL